MKARLALALAVVTLLSYAFFAGYPLSAQGPPRATPKVDTGNVRALRDHMPAWANDANFAGVVPDSVKLDALTVVLARSPGQQRAFEKYLADQQDRSSPLYHRWLTPEQIGEQFGPSASDVAMVADWLRSQGLQVNSVSPSRTFVGFEGTAEAVGRAFQTEMRYYKVAGEQRISVSSPPMVPATLLPLIKAIRGLYTMDEQPLHRSQSIGSGPVHSVSPEATFQSSHFLVPADFATIYDVPGSDTGAGVTIGIVGRSRTDFADFANFESKTGISFANPTEVVPTAYGGVDPGPAYTSPPATGTSTSDQSEAELDVMRAASVAPGAAIMLVVATNASGGIGADAQYLVETQPVPVQIINVSFGACEAKNSAYVSYWDSLFQLAAAEGTSVFVSAGDSGASGCDTQFAAPPAAPLANSPNFICSSSYATCVGGTEFNDASNPSQYWSTSNSASLRSALSYIPEGAWNEPLNAKGATVVASGGGGVSTVVPTPQWQTGTGVPTARAGRYTPDLAFSASGHDGYFACFAAGGGSCVANAQGEYSFEYFSGTSAAAPDMAGITALLDQKLGVGQGNLNPTLYQLAASSPSVFHDVTVATSGVASCSVNTASMCNNSAPGTSGLTGGQAGYLVTSGYDEATGLGSLDVAAFLAALNAFSISGQVTLNSAGLSGVTMTLSGGSTASTTTDDSGDYSFTGLTQGLSYTVTPSLTGHTFSPASQVFSSLNANSTATFTATSSTSLIATTTTLTSSENPAVAGTLVTATAFVQPVSGNGIPTGTLAGVLDGIPIGSLALDSTGHVSFSTSELTIGTHTLMVTYSGDATYATSTATITETITSAPNALQFIPVTPCRVADTRNPTGDFGGPSLSAGSTRNFDIPNSGCGIPTVAVAYSLNVTVVPAGELDYLTLWPAGQPQPGVSTLNSLDGRIKANAAITPAGLDGGVSVYVSDATNVILDIDGYFVIPGSSGGTSSALQFYSLAPCRIADTRNAAGPLGGPFLAAATSRSFNVQSSACQIPATAQAYSLNVTALPHTTLTYLTTWPTGETQPGVSTLNALTGAITANAAIVPAGNSATNGAVSIYVSDDADVILDVNGYFAPPATGGLSLYTTTPCRALDTRSASGAINGTLAVDVGSGSCAPPATAQAYVLNATVVPPAALTYLTLWPHGETQPTVSTLNALDGAITSNMAIVPTTNGTIDAYSSNTTQLILDLSSYFAP